MKNYPCGRLTPEDFIKLYERLTPYNDAEIICANVFGNFDIDQKGYIEAKEFLHWLGETNGNESGTEFENKFVSNQYYKECVTEHIKISETETAKQLVTKPVRSCDSNGAV